MESIIGPILALIIGIKYSDIKNKKSMRQMEAAKTELLERLDKVESTVEVVDKEILKKSLQVILPIAQATERLQAAVGVK